jgi:hypothetical protein
MTARRRTGRIREMRRRTAFGLSLVALACARDARALPDADAAPGGATTIDTTRVVLFRDGSHTSLTVQTAYRGASAPFTIVIPAAADTLRPTVRSVSPDLLEHLDVLTAPRLADAWEIDPCSRRLFEGIGLGALGGGQGVSHAINVGDHGVKVDAKFADTPFDASQLVAGDAGKSTRVDGALTRAPLRFDYDSPTLEVPLRFGPVDGDGAEDVVVYVVASERYEAAALPNVTAPTNVEVSTDTWGHFDAAYDAIFAKTIADRPGAVVTELSGSFTRCDPCASFERERDGALRAEEIATLGGDVAPTFQGRLSASPEAQVHETALNLHGPLERREVGRILQQNSGRFRLCYEAALRGDPTIKGRAALGWTIARDGHVVDASIIDSTSNAALDTCLARQPSGLEFARASAPTNVVYGLALDSKPSAELVHAVKSWVVTRLHLRVSRSTPPGALVLRVAGGLEGGHGAEGDGGVLDAGATSSTIDAYQTRYLMHHLWSGQSTCADGRRGHWGGHDFLGQERDTPSVVVAHIGSFRAADVAPAAAPPSDAAGGPDAASDGSASPSASPPRRSGCGACSVGQSSDAGGMSPLLVGLVLALATRRHGRHRKIESTATAQSHARPRRRPRGGAGLRSSPEFEIVAADPSHGEQKQGLQMEALRAKTVEERASLLVWVRATRRDRLRRQAPVHACLHATHDRRDPRRRRSHRAVQRRRASRAWGDRDDRRRRRSDEGALTGVAAGHDRHRPSSSAIRPELAKSASRRGAHRRSC